MPHDVRARRRKGFTLTELAIVLSIIGAIFSAVWVAAGHVRDSSKTQRAVAQALQILGGYRSVYAQHGVDVGSSGWADITCMGVNANFFPADMLTPGVTCTASPVAGYPVDGWNGKVTVQARSDWPAISITYSGLSKAGCIGFATGASVSNDLVYENINGASVSLPPVGTGTPMSALTISNDCTSSGNTNSVQLGYKPS